MERRRWRHDRCAFHVAHRSGWCAWTQQLVAGRFIGDVGRVPCPPPRSTAHGRSRCCPKFNRQAEAFNITLAEDEWRYLKLLDGKPLRVANNTDTSAAVVVQRHMSLTDIEWGFRACAEVQPQDRTGALALLQQTGR